MVGSAALARELKSSGQRLHLMLSLEMLGYTAEEQNYPDEAMKAVYGNRGDFIALVANTGAAALLPGLSRGMGERGAGMNRHKRNRGRLAYPLSAAATSARRSSKVWGSVGEGSKPKWR